MAEQTFELRLGLWDRLKLIAGATLVFSIKHERLLWYVARRKPKDRSR